MEDYISEITDGVLTLDKRLAVKADENSLMADQYFILVFYTTNISFLRNYKAYKGDFYYHSVDKCYYLSIFKLGMEHGYYVSKSFDRTKNTLKGRVMLITVNTPSSCVELDSN